VKVVDVAFDRGKKAIQRFGTHLRRRVGIGHGARHGLPAPAKHHPDAQLLGLLEDRT